MYSQHAACWTAFVPCCIFIISGACITVLMHSICCKGSSAAQVQHIATQRQIGLCTAIGWSYVISCKVLMCKVMLQIVSQWETTCTVTVVEGTHTASFARQLLQSHSLTLTHAQKSLLSYIASANGCAGECPAPTSVVASAADSNMTRTCFHRSHSPTL